MRQLKRLISNVTLLLVLVASILAWLPLVLAGQTPAAVAATPIPDQRSEAQLSGDLVEDGSGRIQQLSAPSFNALCDNGQGLWAQTLTAGLTANLSEVELLLLRRSPEIVAAVQVEIRAVDDRGLPTDTVLGRGATAATIPVHWSQPGWLTVSLDAPVQLPRGQKVAIFPTSTASNSGACYEWVSSGLDLYVGGSLTVTDDAGESFVLAGSKDAAFRTWVR